MIPAKTEEETLPILSPYGVDPAPLSFAQERIWFLQQLAPDSPVYNLPIALRMSGPLSMAVLQQSINEIVCRHAILRAVYPMVNGQPVQVIVPHGTVPVTLRDLRDAHGHIRDAEIVPLAAKEARYVFDLAQGPLLRVSVLRLGKEEHVLLVIVHHMVADGRSMRLLARELAALYAAFSTGAPSPLSEPALQYTDFAFWQRRWMEGREREIQLAYWQKRLQDAPLVLELPSDRARPALQSHRGASLPFVLSKGLSDGLREFSRREGVTLFTTLLAAFQTLLHRYTEQNDLSVGTTVSYCNDPELDGAIGPFANNLLLRVNLSANPTFRRLLAEVRQTVLETHAQSDLPFEFLVEVLRPERDLSRSPLFQVAFLLHQETLLQNQAFPGLTVTELPIANGTSRFDLTLEMVDAEEELSGVLEYSTDLFGAAAIARMRDHFQTLLQGAVDNPDQRIATLPLLKEKERRQLLITWNATAQDYSLESDFPELFEAQVNLTPDAVAVVFAGGYLTYRELNRRANLLAHYLRTLGVGPEVAVGIYVERSVEMLVGLLGVFKAGGAYLPLDPTYPQERVAFMLTHAGVEVVLTQKKLCPSFPEQTIRLVCLDTDWDRIVGQSDENPPSTGVSNRLAYVLYTSGSTGEPKGVEVPHSALTNLLFAMARELELKAEDTLLAVTTISFDIAVLELCLPLMVGARVVIARREEVADGARLAELLTHGAVTVMQATPATWGLLVNTGWQGNRRLKILCGGEALSRDLADELLARSAGVWNLYGPTETTVWSAFFRVEAADRAVPIGRPIGNTQLYILDAHLQPLPIGVPGEIHIGGPGLARGYRNCPEPTVERFIPHPLNGGAGARLYRTGDRARYLADGTIEFLGRLDTQVKLRGFRIELGEIESVLRQHATVKDVIVLAREDIHRDKRLVAYVIPKRKPGPAVKALRIFLRQKLPDYMVPAAFVLLDAFPLMPNGKVNRHALPPPERGRLELGGGYVSPRTRTEQALEGIWTQVLELDRLGIYENFFDLGGDSLLAVSLFARIEKIFGKKLPLITLFQAATIEQLARLIDEQSEIKSRSSLVEIQPQGSKRPIFFPHLLGGDVLYGRNFASYLGPDQPVYGFQVDAQMESFASLEAMAAYYVRELRNVQSAGPYYLAGYCSAAVIAYEMARQLYSSGDQVGLLAMIDPGAFRAPANNSTNLPRALYDFLCNLPYWFVDDFLQSGPLALFDRLCGRIEKIKRRIVSALSPNGNAPATPDLVEIYGVAGNIPDGDQSMMQNQLRILMNYKPPVYPGRITLIRARAQDLFFFQRPDLGWGDLASGGVEIKIVPGNHATLMKEPCIGLVREQLRAALDQAQRAS